MNTKEKKKFYTPQFSEKASVSIRRLAWAMDIHMTKAVELIVNELSLIFSSSDICPKCEDNTKCKTCAFNNQAATQKTEPAAVKAVQAA